MIEVFDFFSGCGGTSYGFQQAGLDIRMGIDFDHDAAISYQKNFPSADFLETDIRFLNPEDLSQYIGDRRSPILFCGCAPCQPFSRQNRSQKTSDPRRSLLGEFLRFVKHWEPEYVFVENVPGMQKIKESFGPLHEFLSALRSMGYRVDIKVIPALWFGVPQTRERLVLLASIDSPINLPEATHGPGKAPFSTVRDWISNFPPLEAGGVDPLDPQHRSSSLSAINLTRIAATPEGGGREHWPSNLFLECHIGHTGHTDVYGRLAWDRPAAGLTTRCTSYSNGRFGHPEQNRALSVREAACLQTFPRDFFFAGGLASAARQIGNAVPPRMAECVGVSIRRHWLEKTNTSSQR